MVARGGRTVSRDFLKGVSIPVDPEADRGGRSWWLVEVKLGK